MVIAKSKKVKPPMSNTIKNMDYNWTAGSEPPNNQETGVPKAIFLPNSNSLPFEERTVTLEHPVQIGRNVYRATPSPTNTIFECRVLSRHHATLYYDKGHFYLVDNRSSNGTFINNNRCSISQDQEPHEVFSGDVVQFGIPVVENAVNSDKNTFPPVVALLKLYHPDGKEAKLTFNPTMTTPLHLKELYQLNNFVQEAIQREASLEGRLRALRECVERTRSEANASWELFVGEQRLLMRVHTLEAMLAVGKQPDHLHLTQLLDDKKNYQEVAQESLRAAHEQRLALEESLERRSREAAALHHHNCALRLAATNALAELQKLAARCERKMCAARLAIATAEEREQAARAHLPLAYSVQNGEAKMLVVSSDGAKGAEATRGSLEDAVRALPDYIKMLLPNHLLNKVGIKAVSAEGKTAKEFELILQKNNIYDSENKSKQADGDVGVGGSGEEQPGPHSCTDDEKQSRLNHDTGHELEAVQEGDLHADNNANSTFSEPDITDESPSKGGVEYANVLRVMGGLNEEIKVLRERLSAAASERDQLRAVRDELLAAADARALAADTHAPDDDARLAQLQAQLMHSNVAEAANLAEIQRLTASVAELQAELACRPPRDELDSLAALVGDLRAEIIAKDTAIQRLQATDREVVTVERAVATSDSLGDLFKLNDEHEDFEIDTNKISADIDEMFQLDYEDDESDSVTTEVIKEEVGRLEEEQRVVESLQKGSVHLLEEELVRTKESWAAVECERARLARQVAALRRGPGAARLALALSVLVAGLCYLVLPYLS